MGFIKTNKVFDIILFCLFFIFFSFSIVFADMIVLKNGRKLEGLIKAENNDFLEVQVAYGIVKLYRNQISAISRSDSNTSEQIRQEWQIKKTQSINSSYGPRVGEVAVRKLGDHLLVTAWINDNATANLIMDTGATLVVLKSSVALAAGLDYDKIKETVTMSVADGRQVVAKRAVLKVMKVQDMEEKNVEVAIMPKEITDVSLQDGLLGMSFLRRFKFQVDYRNTKLLLEKQ